MWIDTHAHLNDDHFADCIGAAVERAMSACVTHILVIGIDVASSRRAAELAAQFKSLFAVVGIQPNSLGSVGASDWEAIEEMARMPKVVGIGETGLDNYWKAAPLELQEEYFARHLQLCDELQRPVVIHCRDAEADIVRCLQRHCASAGRPIRGVMHSFTGDMATAAQCVALGLHVSFAGMVTFKKNDALRAVAKSIPEHRLLVETDAPYLSPEPHRGKPNEPANVVHTGACLAAIRGISIAELASATSANAIALFGLPTG